MKPPRTQWFNALRHKPRYVGRYLVKPEGVTKPVFRWWNGVHWQYNRTKLKATVGFGNRPGDVWAGCADKKRSGLADYQKHFNLSPQQMIRHMRSTVPLAYRSYPRMWANLNG